AQSTPAPPANSRELSGLVRSSGIRFHKLDFIAPELNGRVGESVEVRFRPHDDTSIEVFTSGRHLCTAYPQNALSEEQKDVVRQLDGTTRAPVAWDHFIGVSTSAAG
ncbi:MAG TPA: Mu transposase C-terminal domain-containing protein, partial [Acidimicrobiales bacterium]|nr:Mu transposase C-terminal domain-containing protein [Acidimicrobiales bacterium]